MQTVIGDYKFNKMLGTAKLMPKVICSIFYFSVLALKNNINSMIFLYKPLASRHQFLDLTQFYCRTNFEMVILQCIHRESDKFFFGTSELTYIELM